MTEHDGDTQLVPLARPVVVTARPVVATGSVMVGRGVMPVGCAWIDLAWMVIAVGVYMGLIEGVLVEFVLKLSPDDPIPIHVLVGGMGLRLMLIAGVAWWRLTRAGHTGDVIGLSLRRGWAEAMLGVPTAVAALAVAMVMAIAIAVLWPQIVPEVVANRTAGLAVFPSMTMGQRVAVAVMAGLTEEVLFRGFLLQRLMVVCRAAWLAILIQAVIFAVPHLYQGPTAVVMILGVGVVFGVVAWWRRSLVAPIVGHALFNVFQFTMVEEVLRRGLM